MFSAQVKEMWIGMAVCGGAGVEWREESGDVFLV